MLYFYETGSQGGMWARLFIRLTCNPVIMVLFVSVEQSKPRTINRCFSYSRYKTQTEKAQSLQDACQSILLSKIRNGKYSLTVARACSQMKKNPPLQTSWVLKSTPKLPVHEE